MIPFFDAEAVRERLDYPRCIAAVRDAMIGLSTATREQPLRQIMEIAPAKLFALMPGNLGDGNGFGVKVVTVFGDPARPGRARHEGVVILFDPDTGAPACIGDAGAITEIRTACASAVATDALARADATTLGLFGCGAQAWSHLAAIPLVRPITEVRVWGRDPARAEAFAERAAHATPIPVRAVADPREAARCDIVCTVTGSTEPVLFGDWIAPGTHVNLVGSSYAGPVECDGALVAKGRLVVDSRRAALVAAAEFLNAKSAGLVTDDHIVGEIGDILSRAITVRTGAGDITLYKSLGHVVQDLAALAIVAHHRG